MSCGGCGTVCPLFPCGAVMAFQLRVVQRRLERGQAFEGGSVRGEHFGRELFLPRWFSSPVSSLWSCCGMDRAPAQTVCFVQNTVF